MLRIEIVNDGTANRPENTVYLPNQEPFAIIGNYDYRIFINNDLVGSGRIEEHNRLSGWQGLVSCLNRAVNESRFDEYKYGHHHFIH